MVYEPVFIICDILYQTIFISYNSTATEHAKRFSNFKKKITEHIINFIEISDIIYPLDLSNSAECMANFTE